MALSAFVRNLERRGTVARAAWSPLSRLFPAQIEVFRDRESPRLIVDCSRRSGKSHLAAVLLTDLALSQPRFNGLYLTQSSTDARDILWRLLLDLNDDFQLGGKTNEQRLEITYPNGSFIRLAGCQDHQEAKRRIKGRRWHFVIIDEAQDFPDYLQEMVEAGLIPTLVGRGRRGRILMMGTPSQVPGVGYWEECCLGGTWKRYHWTMRENLALDRAEVESYLTERAAALGATSSIHLREDLGERPPPDESSGLVYVYDRTKNDPTVRGFSAIWKSSKTDDGGALGALQSTLEGRWYTGIGIDLGHTQSVTALAAVGICDAAPGLAFLRREFIAPKRMLVPALAALLAEWIADLSPVDIRCDEGGLGVALADQLRAPPYSLPVNPADKLHVSAGADALNTALTTGRLLVFPETRAAKDMGRVRWDPEARKKGKRKEALQPHSDILPACRYIWPAIFPLLDTVAPPPPRKTSEQRELDDLARLRRAKSERRPDWRSW